MNSFKLTQNEIATEKSPCSEGTSQFIINALKLLMLCFLFSSLHCTTREVVSEIPDQFILADGNKIETRKGITYVNNKVFSGWIYSVFATGDTFYLQSFLNGKEHGISKRWFSNKQKEEKRFYKNGKKEGQHLGWWENGQQKYEYHFVNDLYEGELKEWYLTGQPYKIFHYTKGQENGLQQVWEDNGKIRSNYEIKNGRLFGLMGPKPCASLWKNDSTVVQSH